VDDSSAGRGSRRRVIHTSRTLTAKNMVVTEVRKFEQRRGSPSFTAPVTTAPSRCIGLTIGIKWCDSQVYGQTSPVAPLPQLPALSAFSWRLAVLLTREPRLRWASDPLIGRILECLSPGASHAVDSTRCCLTPGRLSVGCGARRRGGSFPNHSSLAASALRISSPKAVRNASAYSSSSANAPS
jgi:hypothetical protein